MLLTGCATGYHSIKNPIAGWTGGYWEENGPGQLIQVNFDGNGYSKQAKVEDYLMLRCAEVAQAHHKPYFSLYGSIAEAIVGRRLSGQFVSSVANGQSGRAYMLLEDDAGADRFSTTDTLARFASLHPVDGANRP